MTAYDDATKVSIDLYLSDRALPLLENPVVLAHKLERNFQESYKIQNAHFQTLSSDPETVHIRNDRKTFVWKGYAAINPDEIAGVPKNELIGRVKDSLTKSFPEGWYIDSEVK